jgi:hypothetical protein
MLRWHNVGSISAFLMISDDRLEREAAELDSRKRVYAFSGAWWTGSYILSTMLLNRPLASAA